MGRSECHVISRSLAPRKRGVDVLRMSHREEDGGEVLIRHGRDG